MVYHSLYGSMLGVDTADGSLVSQGGVSSAGRSLGDPNKVVLWDDFIGDVIADQWDLQEGTDGATGALAVLAGGIGGVVRFTTGDAGTGLAADMEQMTGALQWQASNGGLTFECRLKLSAITTCYVFVGLTDLAASLEAPVESAASANTLTSTATDAVGFMFDTRMTDDAWWLVGVKADVDATHQNITSAPVADTYAKFRIEVTADGHADFFYNGARVGVRMSNAITPATDLTPTINVSKTSVAASMTADLDYIYVAMNR